MRFGPVVATLFVLGGIPFLVWYQHRKEDGQRRAIEQIEESLQQNENRLGAQNLSRQLQFVQRTQGEAAAKLFQKCNQFQPTQPTGVIQCRAIVDRMNRDMAAKKSPR